MKCVSFLIGFSGGDLSDVRKVFVTVNLLISGVTERIL